MLNNPFNIHRAKVEVLKEDPAHYAAIARNNAAKQAERDKADPEAAKKREKAKAAINKKFTKNPIRPGNKADMRNPTGSMVGTRESTIYVIPEEIPANERTAFHGAAADAAKKGKKSFNFGGKTHPVTMKKDLANKIADQKESVNESFSYHNDMAKAHKSHAMRHNSEFHHGNHNYDDEDMHGRAIDIHKQAHAAHIQARNLSSYDSEGKYKKAAKDAHSLSQTAIGTTKDAGKFKTGKPKHSFPKLVSHTKLAKESTMSFREKLVSLYEGDRAAHYKGATAPEGMHDKFKSSKGAMDMVNVQKSVEADGMKAAKDTADNIKKSIPGRKMRSNDKKDGDNTIIPAATPVKDPAAKIAKMESYGISGNKVSNNLLDAIAMVEDMNKIHTVDIDHTTGKTGSHEKKHGITIKKNPKAGPYAVDATGTKANLQKYLKKHYDGDHKTMHPEIYKESTGEVTEKRQIRTNRVRGDRTMHDDHVKKGMGMGGEQSYSTVNKLDQRHYAKYISKKSGHDSYFDGNDLVHKKSSKTVVPNALISKNHSPNQLADKMKAHGDKHKGN